MKAGTPGTQAGRDSRVMSGVYPPYPHGTAKTKVPLRRILKNASRSDRTCVFTSRVKDPCFCRGQRGHRVHRRNHIVSTRVLAGTLVGTGGDTCPM